MNRAEDRGRSEPKAEVSRFWGGLRWVDPASSCVDVANAVLPAGTNATGTAFPCRITIERKRIPDRVSGRRVTRDWLVGHFLLWRDGAGAPDMDRNVARQILADARTLELDEIIVFGQISLIASPSIDFRQFWVRALASLPAGDAS